MQGHQQRAFDHFASFCEVPPAITGAAQSAYFVTYCVSLTELQLCGNRWTGNLVPYNQWGCTGARRCCLPT